MSRIGIGANVTQPSAQCMSCKHWKSAGISRLGFKQDGHCTAGYCKKDFQKRDKKRGKM